LVSLACYIYWQKQVKEKIEEKASRENAVLARELAYARSVRCGNCVNFFGKEVNVNVLHSVFPKYGNTIPPIGHECFEVCAVCGDLEIHAYVLRNIFKLNDVRLLIASDAPQRAFSSNDFELAYQMVQSVIL
jgi:hypothetical protein